MQTKLIDSCMQPACRS